jgi:predicted DNA-binding ribbon-helix-helix protein
MTTGRFLSTLFDEVVELRGEVGNFASLLRVIACRWISGEVNGVAQQKIFALASGDPPPRAVDAHA